MEGGRTPRGNRAGYTCIGALQLGLVPGALHWAAVAARLPCRIGSMLAPMPPVFSTLAP